MKAVTFDGAIPRYVLTRTVGSLAPGLLTGRGRCTRMQDIDEPALPGEDWVRVRTRLGGICGSDLNLVGLGVSPSTSPLSSFPFVIGHENVGVIDEVGRGVSGLHPGDRVVANPLLSCTPRGIDPACAPCSAGRPSRCEHFTDGVLPAGIMLGSTRSVGGSWGEVFVAHRSRVHAVAREVPDEAAVMVEPLATTVSAILADPPRAGEQLLVIGGGTIGLMAVAALHALRPDARVTVLTRHGFQAEFARQLGAQRTVLPSRARDYREELAEAGGTRLLEPILGERIGVGGFDRCYLCVGSSTATEDALRFTRAGGEVVLLGNVAKLKSVDWTPVWLKELRMRGSLCYNEHSHGGADHDSFELALQLVTERRVGPLESLVTHVFPVDRFEEALALSRRRSSEPNVKIALSLE